MIIQVVCWVELPEQRVLGPIFVKIWIPINGTQQCGIGSPEIHRNFYGLMGCQRDPRIWGVTILVRTEITSTYLKMFIFCLIFFKYLRKLGLLIKTLLYFSLRL